MKTTPKALKDLFVALGGDSSAIDGLQTVDVLNAIAEKYEGEGDATRTPDAIDAITAVADNIGGGGEGGATANVTLKLLHDAEGDRTVSLDVVAVVETMTGGKTVVKLTHIDFPWVVSEKNTIAVPMAADGYYLAAASLSRYDHSVLPVFEGGIEPYESGWRIFGDCSISMQPLPSEED